MRISIISIWLFLKKYLKKTLAYITFVFILIISFATIFKLLVLKLILRVTTIVGSKISSMVFQNIISQSYLSFTKFNTSNLISSFRVKNRSFGKLYFQKFANYFCL